MRILLAYSTNHFHPDVTPSAQPHWGSSANILARTLHALLEERGEVKYVDAEDVGAVRGEQFDLFVGPANNSARLLAACSATRVILIAVNQHPAARNRRLLDFAARHKLPHAAFAPWDLVDAGAFSDAADRAAAILIVGNVATLNSYLEHGLDVRRLRALNYATSAPAEETARREDGPLRIVYAASEIGLRKGFDIVASLVPRAIARGVDFRLDIVGRPSTPYYETRLAELAAAAADRVHIHGWLDAAGARYEQVLTRGDVLLFPSLEEGQAGTVLDAMARGVVPLVTPASGVDYAPLGLLEPDPESESNLDIIARASLLGHDELEHLRRKTLEAYRELHVGFEAAFAEALDGAISGSPWPKASVILPVFNKETTITRLLDLLDRPLTAYPDVELHVILDGCSDRSEERVRAFFAKRTAYPVRIDVTPDIFEVKTNNIGLKAATGRYGVIVQDDNFVYDADFLFEAITFLEKDRRAAILGGLAGVNFYPRGTTGLEGPGQIAMEPTEVYWRQDASTNPALRDRIYGVDACMRGPLIVRKSFLEEHGYLDEAYAPLYQDDMDLAFRAMDRGYRVYCCLMDVDNESDTMGAYSAERWAWMEPIMRRNTDLFYDRWTPSTTKDYLWVHRLRIASGRQSAVHKVRGLRHRARRRYIAARKTWFNIGPLYRMYVRIRAGSRSR